MALSFHENDGEVVPTKIILMNRRHESERQESINTKVVAVAGMSVELLELRFEKVDVWNENVSCNECALLEGMQSKAVVIVHVFTLTSSSHELPSTVSPHGRMDD